MAVLTVPVARPRGRRRAAALAGVPLGYLALAVAVTASWWAPLGRRVTAVNEPDAVLFGWLFTWTPYAVGQGRMPLFSDALNHPDGINLMWNNGMLLPGLLLAPVTAAFGGLGTVTVVTTLGLATTATATYLCLRALPVATGPAAVGGLLAGFSPAMVAQAAGGHPNLVLDPLAPVLVLLSVRLLTAERPARSTAVLLGVTAGAQVYVGEEILFLAGVVVALFVLVLVASAPREAARRAGPVAGRALLALGVFALVGGPGLAYQLLGPLPQEGSPFLPGYYSTDLAGFVVGTGLQLLTTDADVARSAGFAGGPEEHTALLGLPLLVVLLAALVRYRADAALRTVLAVAAGTAVLGLGPELVVDGVRTGVPLPWALLLPLPGFEHVISTRLPLFTAGLAGAALALALHRVRGETAGVRAVAGVAVAVALLPLVPAPLPARDAPPTPAFLLSDDPALDCPGGSVLVLPFPVTPDTDAMAWQQAAGMSFAMPGGYFIGPSAAGRATLGGQPTPTGRLLRDVEADGVVREVTPAVARNLRADLARWGTCSVVLGPARHRDALLAQATALLGAPPEHVGDVAVWRDPRG
ncbi:glycosyl transferase [Pseudonocardia hydrocarbonoxydans]|uniref:Glycosyl transferase n=1 Tax=Pseudonocardia hydrocarbonoxydans TaxID=76726 RepID=A0A4Y3WN98_9PSEU|nr:hypothetical protein [Pseudonocardia hydrocarbonoxydans]GEC19711.1 glycosyl transferase [Pseudonocardia hydrocarbonoxydans]